MLDQRADFYQDTISKHMLPYLPAQPFHATNNIEKMTKLVILVISEADINYLVWIPLFQQKYLRSRNLKNCM